MLSDDEKKNFPLADKIGLLDDSEKLELARKFASHEFFEAITGIDMIKPFKEVDLEGTYPLAERRGEQFYEIITKSTIMTPLLKEVDSLMAKIEGKELVGWDKEVSSVSKDVLFMAENSPKEVQDVVKAKLLEVWREAGVFEKVNHFMGQREKYQNNHLHVLLEKK